MTGFSFKKNASSVIQFALRLPLFIPDLAAACPSLNNFVKRMLLIRIVLLNPASHLNAHTLGRQWLARQACLLSRRAGRAMTVLPADSGHITSAA
jgi:hypothetical protein